MQTPPFQVLDSNNENISGCRYMQSTTTYAPYSASIPSVLHSNKLSAIGSYAMNP